MRISDWSSDVCSSDLDPRQHEPRRLLTGAEGLMRIIAAAEVEAALDYPSLVERLRQAFRRDIQVPVRHHHEVEVTDGSTATLLLMPAWQVGRAAVRSEEHTSELQSLMRISYAVFCLKKKKYRPRHMNK